VRRGAVLFAVLTLAGCTSGDRSAAPTSTRSAADDIPYLVERIEEIHPDPWHAVSEVEFKEAATRLEERIDGLTPDQQLVELMRLTALLGERDGHGGVFPLDPTHERTLHVYPIRLYEFSDGLYVVDALERPQLVGARVDSIGGRPVEEVMEAVRPLVPADNDMSRKARVPQYMLVAEVLRGLGIVGSFELDGRPVALEPIEATEYVDAYPDLFRPQVPQGLPRRSEPPYLAGRSRDRWTTTLRSAVYGAYNVTLGDTTAFADALTRSGRKGIIVDVRHNPGGENGTYPPLLEALRGHDVTVLIGRTTYSAAANFITELEQIADVTFVGEPSGGAPNLYGDPLPVTLPATGLTVQVASVYWLKSTPDDPRVAIEPDVRVELSSNDFLAGRDPVLAAALAAL
jgi:hypothetical protein